MRIKQPNAEQGRREGGSAFLEEHSPVQLYIEEQKTFCVCSHPHARAADEYLVVRTESAALNFNAIPSLPFSKAMH